MTDQKGPFEPEMLSPLQRMPRQNPLMPPSPPSPLQQAALEALPDAIRTFLQIAVTYATTNAEVKKIEAEGHRIINDAAAYVQRSQEDRQTLRDKADQTLRVMTYLQTLLANSNLSEAGQIALIGQLPHLAESLLKERAR